MTLFSPKVGNIKIYHDSMSMFRNEVVINDANHHEGYFPNSYKNTVHLDGFISSQHAIVYIEQFYNEVIESLSSFEFVKKIIDKGIDAAICLPSIDFVVRDSSFIGNPNYGQQPLVFGENLKTLPELNYFRLAIISYVPFSVYPCRQKNGK